MKILNEIDENFTLKALKSDLLLSVPSYKAKLRAFYHAWNPLDSSRHIYIKPNAFTLHRNPVAQSTDGARAKIGFECGRHIWEIMVCVENSPNDFTLFDYLF